VEVPNPSCSHISRLICLPNSAANYIQAGQPTFTVSPSIDADGVTKIEGDTTGLNSMSAYQSFTPKVPPWVIERFPQQYVFRLKGKRYIWIDVGVYEQVCVCLVPVDTHILQEVPMIVGHVR
jgi:hypothetical protein